MGNFTEAELQIPHHVRSLLHDLVYERKSSSSKVIISGHEGTADKDEKARTSRVEPPLETAGTPILNVGF